MEYYGKLSLNIPFYFLSGALLKVNGTLSAEAIFHFTLPFFLAGTTFKSKNFSHRSKFLTSVVDPMLEKICCLGKQTGSHRI